MFTKLDVFSIFILYQLWINIWDANEAWKKRIEWVTTSQIYRDDDGISGEPTEFEWNIFPGFTMLQLCGKSHRSAERLGTNTRNFHRKNYYCMSMFNDISVTEKAMKKIVLANARVVKVLVKRFGIGQWSFLCPGSEKKWSSAELKSTRSLGSYRGRNVVGIRRKRMSYFSCNDSIVQV